MEGEVEVVVIIVLSDYKGLSDLGGLEGLCYGNDSTQPMRIYM